MDLPHDSALHRPHTGPDADPPPRPRVDLDEAGWAAARKLYAAGDSPRLIAERFGIGERTVRRRAMEEGWPRRAVEDEAYLDVFATNRKVEVNELLMSPEPRRLSHFAFRRAAEAAAVGRPAEASHWLRVVDQLRRNTLQVEDADMGPSAVDHLRARYAARLDAAVELDLADRQDRAEPSPRPDRPDRPDLARTPRPERPDRPQFERPDPDGPERPRDDRV